MLSTWLFAICEVCSYTCSSCQLKSLFAVGRELNCIKGICPVFSLMFHTKRMKTGWECGAVTTVFVLCFVIISEKRCSFLSRMWLPVVAEAMVCCCQKGQAIPSAYFVSVVLNPIHWKTTLFLLQLKTNPAKVS